MRLRIRIAVILAGAVILASVSWARNDTATERIFFDGKIFTAEPEHPYAEAVLIRGDKIVAVGNSADIARIAAKDAQRIDLRGKTLLPGIIDSHVHAIDGGLSLHSADVGDAVHTVAELAAFVAEAKKSGRGLRGDILVVSGMPLEMWSKTDELNAQFSAGAYEHQSLFLEGMDGHTGWANRALRLRAGVNKDFLSHISEADRKYYGVGSDMEPNGFAVDKGLAKIEALLPKPSREQFLEAGRSAVHYLHSLGITSWLDPLADESILTAYRDLSDRGELTAHVAALPEVKLKKGDNTDPLVAVQALRREFKDVRGLTIPGIKVFADGVVEYPSQSAAMSSPYKNTGRNGDLLFEPAQFAKLVIEADKQGLLVHVHAIGDKAVTEALNGMEAARKANGDSGIPHTITHLQFVLPSDIPRFKALGVIASFQLLWASAEPDTIELIKPYIDPAVYAWQYPARSILDAGGTISGASDWSVSSPNVFWAMYQAETRKGPEGVLNAEECMPREAMLLAYTRNSAIAMRQLDKIGSIAPGKQADLVLLDRDVLTVSPDELRNTTVLWTMQAGKMVYEAPH
ncbi:MAG TPA: amidohydrolase [Candidatus Acidoferrales bacterium]|nr:amidohydrolase [Candidatus Acidoferrales bacterium]